MRSAWKTFETSFRPIIDSLKRHRALLSDEKLTAAIAEIQGVHQLTEIKIKNLSDQIDARITDVSRQVHEAQKVLSGMEATQRQNELHHQRQIVEEKLGAPDYGNAHFYAANKRFLDSGNWILDNQQFQKWFHSSTPADNILYIHGMPGAGMLISSQLCA